MQTIRKPDSGGLASILPRFVGEKCYQCEDRDERDGNKYLDRGRDEPDECDQLFYQSNKQCDKYQNTAELGCDAETSCHDHL